MKISTKASLFLLLALSVQLSFAQNTDPRTDNRHRSVDRENSIILNLSSGISSHNQMLAIAKIEYNRQIVGNWFWGVAVQSNFNMGRRITYDYAGGGSNPYRNTVRQNIFVLSGMAYYRIAVIKNRLFLRPGLGLGAGYHQITNNVDNSDLLHDRVLPYFNAELSWLLRLGQHVYLKFAPALLFAPESFAISPIKLGAPTDVIPFNTDLGVNLGVGIRF